MNRTLVSCLALMLLTQGCAGPSRGGRAGLITAGIATATVGLMLSSNVGDDDGGLTELMMAGGLVLTGYGFLSPSAEDEAPPPPLPVAQPSAPQAVHVAPLPPLPSIAADPTTVRLARQVRRLAAVGQCEPARTTASLIAQRSPDYYRALVASPVLRGCMLHNTRHAGGQQWLAPQRRGSRR